jgi:hypothetical protein
VVLATCGGAWLLVVALLPLRGTSYGTDKHKAAR